jgi:hypothetical protein
MSKAKLSTLWRKFEVLAFFGGISGPGSGAKSLILPRPVGSASIIEASKIEFANEPARDLQYSDAELQGGACAVVACVGLVGRDQSPKFADDEQLARGAPKMVCRSTREWEQATTTIFGHSPCFARAA